MGFNTSYLLNKNINVMIEGDIQDEFAVYSALTTNSSTGVLDVKKYNTITFDVSGSFSAKISVEGIIKAGGTFRKVNIYNVSTQTIIDEVRQFGQYKIDVSGYNSVKFIVSEYRNGSIYLNASATISQFNMPKEEQTYLFDLIANPSATIATAYFNTDKPNLEIKVLKSQGLVYFELQEEVTFGGEPITFFKKYINNENIIIPIVGRGNLRIKYRPAYRTAEGLMLDNIKIAVRGKE